MSKKIEAPLNLMEYRLQQKLSQMGIQCLYDQNGKVRMWIRVSPQGNLFSPRMLSLLDFKKDYFGEQPE